MVTQGAVVSNTGNTAEVDRSSIITGSTFSVIFSRTHTQDYCPKQMFANLKLSAEALG